MFNFSPARCLSKQDTAFRQHRPSARMPDAEKQASSNRRHVTSACRACREAKIKCDGKTPICRHCFTKDRQCVYGGRVDRRKVSVRKAVDAFAKRVQQLELFISTHDLEVPPCPDDCKETIDELVGAYAPDKSTSPPSRAKEDINSEDVTQFVPKLNRSHPTPPSEAPRQVQAITPGDHRSDRHEGASFDHDRMSRENDITNPHLEPSLASLLPFYGSIDAEWVWDVSSMPQMDGQPPIRVSTPPFGLNEILPPQNIDSLAVIEDESTDDEVHSEVTNEFSSRLGTLSTTESGDIRFYGATSNLSLVSSGATPKELKSLTKPVARAQARLDALGIGQIVEDDLVQHLINLYFAWHDPSLHVVDRIAFEHARAEYQQLGSERILYSDALANAMCAVGAGLETAKHPDYPTPLGEFFASRSKALLEFELDQPKIATVQALAILSCYEAAQTRDSRGWLFSGMSLRLAFDLGLHLSTASFVANGKMTRLEAHARRVTFWACFITDRMWGLYLGRPFDNSFDAVTVEKPLSDGDHSTNEFWLAYAPVKAAFHDVRLPDHQELLTEKWIDLYEIMAVLGHYLYFRADASNTDLQALAHQTNLRLLDWKSKLPPQLQVHTQLESPGLYLPQALMLHMQYALFVINLHRPFVAKHYIQPEPPVGPGHLHAREMCISSAIEIAKLLRIFESQYTLSRSNVQMVYIAFTAALILVYATIAENNDESHRDLPFHLGTCSHALAELGNIFPNANRTLDVLLKVKRSWQARLVAATTGPKRRGSSATTGSGSKRRRA
ncbi:fungal-specific transcription factor domain-containing protein [Dactylonectria macrodidyma]|uniref:Fungal-specific transcription factor domain-containing protein n=1 Tax=Dactylonectria macrodidyma TaxID=307937 RepID=A0A9P9DPY4_9HYPO|nr:fungal-specific transcription factor domain-containing protein [Dactylonectria macrodidyma]